MEMDCYHLIKRTVLDMLHIDLDSYKDDLMSQHLDTWLFGSGILDWNTYLQSLGYDAREKSRFRDFLTVNVSSFFRDLNQWKRLEEIMAHRLEGKPEGRGGKGSGLRVWSAGCSSGAEPYSLAILLEELSPDRDHFLLATDLCRSELSRSQCGGPYYAGEIQNLSPPQRMDYLEQGGPPFFIRESLASRVEFREHDLLADPFPQAFDLIVCRNVAIYFKEQTQEELFRKFRSSLQAGGTLFIGRTEQIPHFKEMGFRKIGAPFYQRI
jgi:chemotaxis protein methyltransferase CheR